MQETLIKYINALIAIIGDVRLSEVVAWLEVKENAESLLAEGHETEDQQ